MGKNILIVEDDPSYLELLQRALTDAGFIVQALASGKDAVTTINSSQPELILLDIMLPDASGLTILEEVKKNPLTKHIPVFCLTNLPSENGKEKAISLGAHSYLTKVHTRITDIPTYVDVFFKEQTEKQKKPYTV
jgi:DNA-binding response OmpR family regulator